jgi:DNA-directed RNA polymerase subunit RPC12/RpoP
MIPPPDCIWKCPKCGKKIDTHSEYIEVGQQCPQCKKPMTFIPRIKRGPQPEMPGKKY